MFRCPYVIYSDDIPSGSSPGESEGGGEVQPDPSGGSDSNPFSPPDSGGNLPEEGEGGGNQPGSSDGSPSGPAHPREGGSLPDLSGGGGVQPVPENPQSGGMVSWFMSKKVLLIAGLLLLAGVVTLTCGGITLLGLIFGGLVDNWPL